MYVGSCSLQNSLPCRQCHIKRLKGTARSHAQWQAEQAQQLPISLPTWVMSQGCERPQHVLHPLRREQPQLCQQLPLQDLKHSNARSADSWASISPCMSRSSARLLLGTAMQETALPEQGPTLSSMDPGW